MRNRREARRHRGNSGKAEISRLRQGRANEAEDQSAALMIECIITTMYWGLITLCKRTTRRNVKRKAQ